MDCETTRAKLQELLDKSLDARQARLIESHLKECPSCAREYQGFAFMIASIASLPALKPSANFNARVLAALGRAAAPAVLPRPVKWLAGAAVSLVSSWLAALLVLLASRLTLPGAVSAFKLLLEPARWSDLLKLNLAKLVLILTDGLSSLRSLAAVFARFQLEPNLPLQLALSTILAGLLIAAVSRKPASAILR